MFAVWGGLEVKLVGCCTGGLVSEAGVAVRGGGVSK